MSYQPRHFAMPYRVLTLAVACLVFVLAIALGSAANAAAAGKKGAQKHGDPTPVTSPKPSKLPTSPNGEQQPVSSPETRTTPPVNDRYIVVLKKGFGARATAADHGKRYGASVNQLYGSVFKGYSARIAPDEVTRLKRDPRVAFVTADQVVTGAAQTLPTGVNRIDADLSGLRSGDGTGSVSSPKVAVLDSGSGPHTDLNIVGGKACYGNDYNDGNGHGTHVAGIIGAKDDANGVVGIAPGVPIYSVRVLDNSLKGTTSALLCGIDWVTANATSLGIKVANLSLTMAGTDDGNCGNTNNDAVHKAICASVAKGVSYVVAAGNSTADFTNVVPAAYNEVMAVTAASDTNGTPGGGGTMPKDCTADVDDTAADFSNFITPGSADVSHTIAAPGKCIYSTNKGGGYIFNSGTSMASPHVAGTIALCLALGKCSNLTPAKIIDKLRADAAAQPSSYGFTDDPFRPLAGRYYGNLLYAGGYR